MPRGSSYPGPPEALASYAAAVARSEVDSDVKGAKNPYTSRNGHMFSFLDPSGTLAIRLSDALTAEFRAAHDSGDVKAHGATMRGYSSIPPDLIADTEAIAGWLTRAWAWIGTLPPKPTRKRG